LLQGRKRLGKETKEEENIQGNYEF
jgi:hypothetical protein